jgi:hypothetical protein
MGGGDWCSSLSHRALLLTPKGVWLFTAAPHVEGQLMCTVDVKTEVVVEAKEVGMAQWFGENVYNVVERSNLSNTEFPIVDHVPNVVEFYLNVLHMWVEHMVFCEAGGCIIVTIQRGQSGFGEAKAI